MGSRKHDRKRRYDLCICGIAGNEIRSLCIFPYLCVEEQSEERGKGRKETSQEQVEWERGERIKSQIFVVNYGKRRGSHGGEWRMITLWSGVSRRRKNGFIGPCFCDKICSFLWMKKRRWLYSKTTFNVVHSMNTIQWIALTEIAYHLNSSVRHWNPADSQRSRCIAAVRLCIVLWLHIRTRSTCNRFALNTNVMEKRWMRGAREKNQMSELRERNLFMNKFWTLKWMIRRSLRGDRPHTHTICQRSLSLLQIGSA